MLPLATSIMKSSSASPMSGMVFWPVIMGPVSTSMISGILCAKVVFDAILTTGAMGFPVGVPKPVVNKIRLAPDPASAVVLSTSLPGVHSRFNPGFVAYSA